METAVMSDDEHEPERPKVLWEDIQMAPGGIFNGESRTGKSVLLSCYAAQAKATGEELTLHPAMRDMFGTPARVLVGRVRSNPTARRLSAPAGQGRLARLVARVRGGRQ